MFRNKAVWFAAFSLLAVAPLMFAQTSTVTQPSTATTPIITVVTPNGGENWEVGSTQVIAWKYTGTPTMRSLTVLFSADGGKSFNPVSGELRGDTHEYKWTVSVQATDAAFIKITAQIPDENPMLPAFRTIEDMSDGPFSVVAKAIPAPIKESLSMISPKRGDIWENKSTVVIQWTRNGNTAVAPKFYNVFLLTPGTVTMPITIANEVSGTQTLVKWTVNAPATADARVRIVAYFPDHSIETTSDSFTIKNLNNSTIGK